MYHDSQGQLQEQKQEHIEGEVEEKPTDDEGLQAEYDVVICGTGLVQSILASALARAGRSVLHCDGASVYGELDTAWTLADLMEREEELHQRQQQQPQQQHQDPVAATTTSAGKSSIANTATEDCTYSATDTATATATAADTSTTATTTSTSTFTSTPCTTIPLSPQGATTSLTFHSIRRTTRLGITVGSRVITPLGTGIVQHIQLPVQLHVHEPLQSQLSHDPPTKTATATSSNFSNNNNTNNTCITCTNATPYGSIAVALDNWKLTNGNNPFSYFGLGHKHSLDLTDPLTLEDYLHQIHGITSIHSIQAVNLLQDTRSFVFDVSPVVIHAAGKAVDAMLATNVADYLEFKSVEALLWLDGNDPAMLSKVPCSKNDVFTTPLLSPMDKRRLMKFLQLVMDFATQTVKPEQAPDKDNDVDATTDGLRQPIPSEDQVKSLNERQLNQGRSLRRPQNKAVASNELTILQDWMRRPDITLEDYLSRHQNLSPKLRTIIRHALALETKEQPASLQSSMAQLRCHLQALGRYGTTAFLLPMYGTGELSQAFTRSAAVFGATYLLRRAPLGIMVKNTPGSTKDVEGIILDGESEDQKPDQVHKSARQKCFRSRQVVVPTNAVLHARKEPSQQILRRISILNGTLVDGEQRHLFILPPHSVAGHAHSIHGISMDSSLQVAPSGCTILHLTTTLMCTGDDIRHHINTLDKAAEMILGRNNRIAEVYVATFSFTVANVDHSSLPNGVHQCYPCGPAITADVAFEQAEKIFHTICPGQQFLGLSDGLDETCKARNILRGQQDDERLILNSAVGMINGQSTEEEKLLQ